MNAKELIEILEKLDPETKVVVNGYEDGCDEVKAVKKIRLKLNANSKEYYGRHEETKDGECPAILISRV